MLNIQEQSEGKIQDVPNTNTKKSRENFKRVMSITDKSNTVPKSLSLDSFTESRIDSEPSIAFQLMYMKGVNGNKPLSNTKANTTEHTLSLIVDKLMDINTSSNCHLYISINLLPEARKDLKQKTPMGMLESNCI